MAVPGPLCAAGGVLATILVLSTLASPAGANAFLGRDLTGLRLDSRSLLVELEQVLGGSHRAEVEARAGRLEDALRPTFKALPRTSEDRLGPTAVRYLLHRLFVDRHGWFVRGFDSAGEAWNSSSPTTPLGEHVGDEAQLLFEDRLGSRGLSLHEVALLAATLESFVHMETVERLHAAWRIIGLSHVEDHASEQQAVLAIDTYMLMYVLGLNHTTTTKKEVDATWKVIDKAYPHWHETKKWIREVRREVLSSQPASRTSFGTTTRVLEEIAERYGRWQDQECLEMKESLLKLQRGANGRIPLDTFYGAALNGSWQFSESKAYLRQLGALDETEPLRPAVVIPNYVNAPSNCVASSKFYSVCCINECEALLGHLERELAAPDAEPQRVAQVVEQLPSATVEAPRRLQASLVRRLEEIAAHHGGRVPFHGRLFAQWLHHAYPNECPYPHISGTSKPLTAEKWTEVTGEEAVADEGTMRWHIEEVRGNSPRGAASQPPGDSRPELPWTAEEELFVSRPSAPEETVSRGAHSAIGRGFMLIAAAFSMAWTIMQLFATAKDAVVATPQKYVV